MAAIPLNPKHPDRICWGCDKYCPADDLACGNGTIRTMHPVELFGEDWQEWSETQSSAASHQSSVGSRQSPAMRLVRGSLNDRSDWRL